MRRSAFACVGLAWLAVAAPALGKPRLEAVPVTFGFTAAVSGSGCAPVTVSRPVAVGEAPVFDPAPSGGLLVETAIRDGAAVWTLAAADCRAWSVAERPWSVTQTRSLYTIRVDGDGTVDKLAGMRVRGATIARARKQLGAPSKVTRRYREVCRVQWKRLGLLIDFVNFGGRNPCRHGYAQTGRVEGARWTPLVAGDPGVAIGTTSAFLRAAEVGSREPKRRWTLAEYTSPFGDGSRSPSVSALLARDGAVRGFWFWIGAAGD